MNGPAPDFWPNSGYHLLTRDGAGHLAVTDAFLRAYLQRPEIAPIAESCDAERVLHGALMANPREAVGEDRITALADEDARDNYRVMLAFRDRLVAAGTVEACYLEIFRSTGVTIPPLFIDQMANVVVRRVIDGTDDPFRARAAELLFREQTVTLKDGAILLGDAETVEMLATTGGMGSLGKLVVDSGSASRQVDMDVLQPDTAQIYWDRNERYDTVLDISFARPGLDALCRVLEAWVRHFLEAEISIQPVQEINDEKWVWHLGLDAEASALLNDLYEGNEVDDARMDRLLSLFRLEFKDPNQMAAEVRGKPVYLALCMTAGQRLRLKPQNLLVNLPLAAES
ncbi:MAG: hypothetical protein CMM77_10790 [Rhodospirillaceae bacterium]|nr:hypothetical protein [Magnetovibrio sp.]MAY67604.1 hypothetical protein [Rhodospirillaceae bacterium]